VKTIRNDGIQHRPAAPRRLVALALCAVHMLAQAQGGPVTVPAPAARNSTQPASASLPDLGSSADNIISRADERQIGRLMVRNLRDEDLVLEDPESTEYIQALGSRIGAAVQDGDQQLTLFMLRDQSVNASALPGGFIVVNAGLVLLTGTESELAGVVAHEVGHVMQRHIVRAVEAQGRNSLTNIAAVLGAVLIGALSGSPEVAPGLIALAQGAAMQQQINFTRMEEHEADRVGIGYLAAAGFDPNGMAGAFAMMMRQRGSVEDYVPALLLTHPVDTVRVAEARARVASLPSYPRRPDSPNYSMVRERLRVLTSSADTDLRRNYERLRGNDPGNLSLAYAQALAEMKSGTASNAVRILQPLVSAHPELPLLQTALGQAQLADGDGEAAIATYERGLEIAPRNVPLTVRYAEALIDLGKPKKAHMVLLDLFNNVMPTPEQIKLTALAASAAGDTGDAYYYMSEFNLANGDLMLATTQLDLALAAPRLTEVQRKRFIARREEIRAAVREQRGERAARPPQQ
jgi:beta-barrel assembly-enhancing protease